MNGTLRKSAAMALSLMFAFLALLPGGASPAVADAPVQEVVSWDFTYPIEECLPVEHHLVGTTRIVVRFDQQGQPVREVWHYNMSDIVSNPETGESITSPVRGQDRFDYYQDGSVMYYASGLTRRFVVPGQGVVSHQVGRLVLYYTDPYDTDPEVILEAGDQDPSNPILCELLAP